MYDCTSCQCSSALPLCQELLLLLWFLCWCFPGWNGQYLLMVMFFPLTKHITDHLLPQTCLARNLHGWHQALPFYIWKICCLPVPHSANESLVVRDVLGGCDRALGAWVGTEVGCCWHELSSCLSLAVSCYLCLVGWAVLWPAAGSMWLLEGKRSCCAW